MIKNIVREEYFRQKNIPIPKTPNRLQVPVSQNHLIPALPKIGEQFKKIRSNSINSKNEKINYSTSNAFQILNRTDEEIMFCKKKNMQLGQRNEKLEKQIKNRERRIYQLQGLISQNETISKNKYENLENQYRSMVNTNEKKINDLNYTIDLKEKAGLEFKKQKMNYEKQIKEMQQKIRFIRFQAQKIQYQLEEVKLLNGRLKDKNQGLVEASKQDQRHLRQLQQQHNRLIQKYHNQRSQYQIAYIHLQKQITSYKSQHQRFLKEQIQSKKQIQQIKEENKYLQAQIRERQIFQKNIIQMRSQKQKLYIDLEIKRQELQQKDTKLTETVLKTNQMESQIERLRMELQNRRIEYELTFQQNIVECQRKYYEKLEQMKMQVNQAQNLVKISLTQQHQKELKQKNQKIEKIIAENTEIKLKKQQVQIENKKIQIEIQSLTKKNERQQRQHAAYLETITRDFQYKIEELKEQNMKNISNIQLNVESEQKAIKQEYELKIIHLQKQLQNLWQEVKKSKIQEQQKVSNLDKVIQRLQIENGEFQMRLNQLQRQKQQLVEEAKQRFKEINKAYTQKQSLNCEYQESLQNLQKIKVFYENKFGDFQDKISQLSGQIFNLQTENKKLNTAIKNEQISVVILRQKLQTLQNQKNDIEEKNIKMESNFKNQIKKLEQDFLNVQRKLIEENEILSIQIANVKKQYSKLIEQQKNKFYQLAEKNIKQLKSSQILSQIEKDNQKKLNQMQIQRQDLINQIRDVDIRLQSCLCNAKIKQNDAQIMRKQIRDLENELKNAENQIKKLHQSNKKYKWEYERKLCEFEQKIKNTSSSRIVQSQYKSVAQKLESEKKKLSEEKKRYKEQAQYYKRIYERELQQSKNEKIQIICDFKKISQEYQYQMQRLRKENAIMMKESQKAQQHENCIQIIEKQSKIEKQLTKRNKEQLQLIQILKKQIVENKRINQKLKKQSNKIKQLEKQIEKNQARVQNPEKKKIFQEIQRRIQSQIKHTVQQYEISLKEKSIEIQRLHKKIECMKLQNKDAYKANYEQLEKEREYLLKQNSQKLFYSKDLALSIERLTSEKSQIEKQLSLYKEKWKKMLKFFNHTNYELTGYKTHYTSSKGLPTNINSSRTHRIIQNNQGFGTEGSTVRLKESMEFLVNQFNENTSVVNKVQKDHLELEEIYPNFNYEESFCKVGQQIQLNNDDKSSDGVVMDEIQ